MGQLPQFDVLMKYFSVEQFKVNLLQSRNKSGFGQTVIEEILVGTVQSSKNNNI